MEALQVTPYNRSSVCTAMCHMLFSHFIMISLMSPTDLSEKHHHHFPIRAFLPQSTDETKAVCPCGKREALPITQSIYSQFYWKLD